MMSAKVLSDEMLENVSAGGVVGAMEKTAEKVIDKVIDKVTGSSDDKKNAAPATPSNTTSNNITNTAPGDHNNVKNFNNVSANGNGNTISF